MTEFTEYLQKIIMKKDIYLRPYVLKDTFEDGSFSGWTSYPMVQDYGYNPFLSPKKEIISGKGNYVLWCKTQAYYPGTVRLGFIKKVNFWVNSISSIQFKYNLKSYESVKQIRFCFVPKNGKYIEFVQKDPIKDKWQDFYFCLKNRIPGNKPAQILSIFIEAEIKSKHPDEGYELKIDDVYVKALRPYEPILSEPAYKEHPQYGEAYVVKSYLPKDDLNIAVDVPEPIRNLINRLEIILISPQNKILYQEEVHYSGKLFGKTIKVFDKDNPGFWKLQIGCKDGAGNMMLSKTYDILQIPQDLKNKKSPFLYFEDEDRKIFQENLGDKEVNEIYQNIKKGAEETRNTVTAKKFPDIDKLDDQYFLFGLKRYFMLLKPVAEMVEINAFNYFINRDDKPFNAVKNALLTMSSWKEFHHPWIKKHGQFIYYLAGEVSQKLAFGYDVIASSLNSDERKKIAHFFLNTFVVPAYKEYYSDNRIPAKSSNWEAHILSGAILSGLSILNDIKREKIIPYLIPLIQTLKKMLDEYLLGDGSSAESVGYLAMSLKSISNVIPALKRVLNIDFAKEYNIEESLKYTMYCSKLSCGWARLDYGDIGPYPEHLEGLAYFVKNSSKQITRFLWQNYKQKEMSDIIWHSPNQNVFPGKNLPSETIFHKKGIFVYRSSWNKDCLFFSFHCGPFFNHAYADNGSFYLYFKGDLLLGRYGVGFIEYYDNPYYNSYFTQAIGHNTLIADDNPISQKFSEWPTKSLGLQNFPEIINHLFSNELNFVSGDLSSVYDNLKNHNRSILQIKPGEFFIIDRLEHVNHKPTHYSQLFHPSKITTSIIENNRIKIEGRKSLLTVTPIWPEKMVIEKHSGHIPLRDYQTNNDFQAVNDQQALDELHKRYYFKITASKKQVKNLLISHMQVFDKNSKQDCIQWQKNILEKGTGIRKIKQKSQIELYFASSDSSMIKGQNIESDAEICGIFHNLNNKSIKIFFHRATYLIYKGKRIVESKKPVTGIK